MGGFIVPGSTPAPAGKFNYHDLKVIAFQVLIAAAQAALIKLQLYHFGMWTPYVLMGVQIISEALRRLAVVS